MLAFGREHGFEGTEFGGQLFRGRGRHRSAHGEVGSSGSGVRASFQAACRRGLQCGGALGLVLRWAWARGKR